MRCLLALAIVGCGGGPSVTPVEPEVRIATKSCTVMSGGFLIADIDYEVTLEISQAFESLVGTGIPGQQGNSTYTCGAWSNTFIGSDNRGCERAGDFDPATELVRHQFTTNLGDTPVQFAVSIVGSVLTSPGSTTMLANAGDTVECDVPPTP